MMPHIRPVSGRLGFTACFVTAVATALLLSLFNPSLGAQYRNETRDRVEQPEKVMVVTGVKPGMVNAFHDLERPVELLANLLLSLKPGATVVVMDRDPAKVSDPGRHFKTRAEVEETVGRRCPRPGSP